MRILFQGDSITDGGRDPQRLPSFGRRVRLLCGKGNSAPPSVFGIGVYELRTQRQAKRGFGRLLEGAVHRSSAGLCFYFNWGKRHVAPCGKKRVASQ